MRVSRTHWGDCESCGVPLVDPRRRSECWDCYRLGLDAMFASLAGPSFTDLGDLDAPAFDSFAVRFGDATAAQIGEQALKP